MVVRPSAASCNGACVSIAVVVERPFAWQGVDVVAGDVLVVRPVDAASLTYQRKVTLAPAGLRVQQVRDEARRKGRTYRRRDLVAEVPCDSLD